MKLSHLDHAGRARMVDVGDKPLMDRTAVATGTIRMSQEAFRQVAEQAVAKGDVLAVSEVAGMLAAKRTAELILSAIPWASIMSRSRRHWPSRCRASGFGPGSGPLAGPASRWRPLLQSRWHY